MTTETRAHLILRFVPKWGSAKEGVQRSSPRCRYPSTRGLRFQRTSRPAEMNRFQHFNGMCFDLFFEFSKSKCFNLIVRPLSLSLNLSHRQKLASFSHC